jgi:hypothetical protein
VPLFHKKTAAGFPGSGLDFFYGNIQLFHCQASCGEANNDAGNYYFHRDSHLHCKTPLNKGFGCIINFHGAFVNQNYSSICLIGKFPNQ